MDTDLFQILTLILLLGLLLTLFGVLQSLGAIRRTLEGRGSAEPAPTPAAAEAPVAAVETPVAAAEPEPEPQHSTWAAGDVSPPATIVAEPEPEPEPEPARTGWPAPQEAAAPVEQAAAPLEEDPFRTAPVGSAGTDTPAGAGASSGGGARALYGDQGLTAATPNDAALQPAEREPEPEPAATGAAAASNEDPQDQPFERDGRWWFRRGDELLVYEEQTGQWVAAGEPSSSGSVATTSDTAATGGAETAAAAGPSEGQVTTQQEAVGSFWKCPSCGAVNGSTATSCRMCFTARP